MKKFLLSFSTIIAFAFYVFFSNGQNVQNVPGVSTVPAGDSQTILPKKSPGKVVVSVPPTPKPKPTPIRAPVPGPIPTPAPAPEPTPVPAPKPSGLYSDGTYTGTVADAFYGNIQVQVTITDGKIADVVFLEYPNDRSHSVAINEQAMPYLKQEAIQAQSANVDIVSGATDTSQAFQVSLASALAQARI